ncbi:hypothetical protein [Escherichia coli]|uniref:hypothetical protein n=1 Tax=Escherichia coli TaxID=562 RepID=UPI001C406DB1|nr:hypothetical protein [Escherichia coli]
MEIDYREIEITEEQRAEVDAAMTALYAVCEKHNLPMVVCVVEAQRKMADGGWAVEASSARHAAGDSDHTAMCAMVTESAYGALWCHILERNMQSCDVDSAVH